MTALHTSYGLLQKALKEAGIRFTTVTPVTYSSGLEWKTISELKVYCNPIVMDLRIAEIEKALEKYLDEIVISSDQNTIYIKIKN